ncbi:MAG TPA: BBP7 family outer membrane beta-barrel protein [Candidatus Anammoximicrobium sp.]|nr:BBP7 family outer membrane beta-barrel protein [Candidatus Anammoximicrobium sp.]
MSRRTTPRNAAICVCAGTLLLVLPQLVAAELAYAPPARVADMHQYVQNNVTCGDGTCSEALHADDSEFDAFDDEPACNCLPDYCADAERWWVSADYLMWWIQGNRLPPLVTTSLPQTDPGQMALILFGDQGVDDDLRHGVRLTIGGWLDECREWGIEGHYFYVGDADGGHQAVVAIPDLLESPIGIDTSSDVNSAGLLLRKTWLRSCQGHVALVGGYRYFRFRERLTIDENLLFDDTMMGVHDNFAVQNDFHGVDLGLAAQMQRGRWSLDALTKLGLGSVRQQREITGQTQLTAYGETATINQGLLTGSGNAGYWSDTQFAFVPELGVNLGYCVTPSLSLRAGYSLLWLTDALRTGDQIHSVVGDSGGPGGVPSAQASGDGTSVCVQGLSLGAEWRR